MFVGVLRVVLHVPGARSLKDKRRAVRSYKDRLVSRLRVSVAEVGALDDWKRAVLGVAVCAPDAARCDQLLAAAARLAADVRDAVLESASTELVSFGAEGSSIEGRPPRWDEVGPDLDDPEEP